MTSPTETELQDLVARGYRITSHTHFIASRVDRPDWKEHMARKQSPWSFDEGLKWVKVLGEAGAADHYRRCYSHDNVCVGPAGLKTIPNSSHDAVGYVERKEAKEES
jgi:hypothetical protein